MKLETFFKYAFLCHRLPERSFFFRGKQFPICARCTGIMIGYIIAIILAVFGIRIHNLFIIILFALPLTIDGGLQYKNIIKSTNIRRCITGILFGFALIDFIIFMHFLALKTADIILHYLKVK